MAQSLLLCGRPEECYSLGDDHRVSSNQFFAVLGDEKIEKVDMKRTAKVLIGRYRSEMLMCTFVALMLASPLVDRDRRVGGMLAFAQLPLLLVGTSYMANRNIVRRVVLPIAVVWLFARLVEAFGDSRHSYTHLAPLAGSALSCAVLSVLLNRFGSISKVTSSVISEAVICYLVIAIAFSQLYWVLDHFVGNAFNQIIPLEQSGTFLYFSLVTLSGLGYGSILPTNAYVRLVAAFENIIGLFYLAVVVSRLVSSYRAKAPPTDDDKDRNMMS
jgi:hypothetical protein